MNISTRSKPVSIPLSPPPRIVVRERAIRFAHGLCATLTTGTSAGELGVVILPAGILPRSGPARLYVRLARTLAEAGVPALRFDASNTGDSPTRRDGLPLPLVMEQEPAAAMDTLTQATGVKRFILVGICAGAYATFLAARADVRVHGIALINPQDFLGDQAWSSMVQAQRYMGSSSRSWSSWRNLLTGRSDYRRIFATVMGRVSARITGRDREAQDRAAAIANGMRELIGRGCRTLCLLSGRDASINHVRALFGEIHHRDFTVQIIPDAEHLLRHPLHRADAISRLVAWAVPAPHPRAQLAPMLVSADVEREQIEI